MLRRPRSRRRRRRARSRPATAPCGDGAAPTSGPPSRTRPARRAPVTSKGGPSPRKLRRSRHQRRPVGPSRRRPSSVRRAQAAAPTMREKKCSTSSPGSSTAAATAAPVPGTPPAHGGTPARASAARSPDRVEGAGLTPARRRSRRPPRGCGRRPTRRPAARPAAAAPPASSVTESRSSIGRRVHHAAAPRPLISPAVVRHGPDSGSRRITRRKLSPRSSDPCTKTTVGAGLGGRPRRDVEGGRIGHGQGRRYPARPCSPTSTGRVGP